MGGKALKNVKTIRKSKDEYDKIKQTIINKLNNILKIETLIEVPGKESFGDLDLLYETSNEINVRQIVIDSFLPKEIVSNGNVLSFDYDNFQIDLIGCKHLEFAKFYFSYGDFGGILGRIVNHYGLKFGHEGFWIYVYTDENNNFDTTHSFGKIVLTTNPREMCDFIGINYDDFCKIKTKQDIFELIKSCRYYEANIFTVLNHEHVKRANIRPMYQEFLKYINIEYIKGGLHIAENKQMECIKYFKKEKEYNEIFIELKRKKELNEKFNGKMLLDLGVEPKNIGKIIKEFRIIYNDDWLLNNSKEVILEKICFFIQNNS